MQEEYPTEHRTFLESAGIRFFQFPIPGNKEPFVVIPDLSVIGALETILDKQNHPILVHCNAGKVLAPCRPNNPLSGMSFLSTSFYFPVVFGSLG